MTQTEERAHEVIISEHGVRQGLYVAACECGWKVTQPRRESEINRLVGRHEAQP